jgi:hypothetical protein
MNAKETGADVLSVDPNDFSLEELYDILAGRSQRLPQVIALSVLRRKDYPEERKINDLQTILLDNTASSRLRTAAAVELARLGSPAAQKLLLAHMENKDAVVSRAVQIGQQEFTRLQGRGLQAAEDAPTMLPSLREAMSRQVGSILPVDSERAQRIRLRKTHPVTASRIMVDLNAAAPPLTLVSDLTYTLHCGDRTFAFVPTQAAFDLVRAADTLSEPIIAGLVAKQDTVETNKWAAYYYLLVNRTEKADELALRLVTRTGRIVMIGTATTTPDQASFSLASVVGHGNAPAEISGIYRSNRLQFTTARSEPRISQQLTPANRR